MRELELIEQLKVLLAPATGDAPWLVRGLGDDAAVTRGGAYSVTSVDVMVDGVHFRTTQLSGVEIGHRALAAALSDLAAMGAKAREAYLILALPAGAPEDLVLGIARGAGALARRYGVLIAGGDLTSSPVLSVAFTVIGASEEPGALVGRDGARPGDLVAVSGELGGSGAGLAVIEGRARVDSALGAELRGRYARPEPRLALGCELARAGAHAMIDLSDGLMTDAHHLARRSDVKIEIEPGALPLAAGVREVAEQLGEDPATFAATAGEDYELCACVPAVLESQLQALQLTVVGRVVDGSSGVKFCAGEASPGGFEHSFSAPNAARSHRPPPEGRPGTRRL